MTNATSDSFQTRPDNNLASADLGVFSRRAALFYEQGHFDATRQLALEILKISPDHSETLLTLANVSRDTGRFDEAFRVLQHLLKLKPADTQAQAALTLTLFYKEDWPRAWRAFDVRFKLMDHPPRVTKPGADGKPQPIKPWLGGQIPDTLLVLGEQGLGDTIQFARFLPLLVKAGARVTCVVQQRLLKLLESLDIAVEWRPSEQAGSVSGIKGWTPLMHLPQALGLAPENFTPQVPYLRGEPERTARWREKLGPSGFKIGIAWQGNPDPRIDLGRSAPLAAFAPLAAIPDVRLISLQAGKAVGQIAQVPFAKKIETLGGDFDSGPDGFLDSAAVMQSLDLIVSVDTSLVHLAGALGRPVFILLKRIGADWRWLYEREDSVWYPSARLFRQKTPGGWVELLQRVAGAVQKLDGGRASLVAPVSIGEFFDKLSILEIKRERVDEPEKLANIEREYAALAAIRDGQSGNGEGLKKLLAELKQVNEQLWVVEDKLRDCERQKIFDSSFIELARSVYRINDRRAALKREINRICGSVLTEEKAYKAY